MVLYKLKQLRWNFQWNELFNMEQPTLLCIWMYICFKTNQMGRGLLLGQIPLSWNRCWFVCILQYISINLHQFSLHIFQCDCGWCIIYLQFVFIYLSSTSLPGGSWSVSDSAFGKVQVSSSDKKRIFPNWYQVHICNLRQWS